jgi:hypothetical protein
MKSNNLMRIFAKVALLLLQVSVCLWLIWLCLNSGLFSLGNMGLCILIILISLVFWTFSPKYRKVVTTLMLAIALISTWWLSLYKPGEPQIFRADLADSTAAIDLRVWRRHEGGFGASILLMYDPNHPEDRHHVVETAQRFNPPRKGEAQYNRNSIHLVLEVSKITDPEMRIVYRKEIFNETLVAGAADYAILSLDGAHLEPGNYRITIKTLEANPELSGITTKFCVGTSGGYTW